MSLWDELKSLEPWRKDRAEEAAVDLYIFNFAAARLESSVILSETLPVQMVYCCSEPKIKDAPRLYIFLSCERLASDEYQVKIRGYNKAGQLLVEERLPWREADKDPSEIFEAIRRTANRLRLK